MCTYLLPPMSWQTLKSFIKNTFTPPSVHSKCLSLPAPPSVTRELIIFSIRDPFLQWIFVQPHTKVYQSRITILSNHKKLSKSGQRLKIVFHSGKISPNLVPLVPFTHGFFFLSLSMTLCVSMSACAFFWFIFQLTNSI